MHEMFHVVRAIVSIVKRKSFITFLPIGSVTCKYLLRL